MDMNFKTKITIGIIIVAIFFVSMYVIFNKNPRNLSVENIPNTDQGTGVSKKEFKIVAFGDSLTAGLGVGLKDSYPRILEDILNNSREYENYNLTFKVINMGVSGETSSGGLDRVLFVIEQKPDLILLGLGANDMLRNTSPALVLSNIDSVIQKIISSKVPVVLLGMQSVASNGREYKRNFDSIYPTLAKKYNLPLVPFFLDGVALQPNLNTADGIHPNRLGYEEVINKNILPVLSPSLKQIIDP